MLATVLDFCTVFNELDFDDVDELDKELDELEEELDELEEDADELVFFLASNLARNRSCSLFIPGADEFFFKLLASQSFLASFCISLTSLCFTVMFPNRRFSCCCR